MFRARKRLAVLVCVIALIHAALALDPHRTLRQYGRQTWQSNDGMPQDSVHCILQTRDGYLWFGTEDGLVRFNGAELTIFNAENTPQLASNAIHSLSEDSSGALWVSTAGGIVLYRNHHFRSFTEKDGLPSDAVWFVQQAPSGRLLAGTSAGLATLDGNRWRTIESTARLSLNSEQRIAQNNDGSLWLAGGDDLLRLDGHSLSLLSQTVTLNGAEITSLAEEADGTLLVGTKEGLQVLSHGKLSRLEIAGAGPGIAVSTMLRDADASVWVGTSQGLAHKVSGAFTLMRQKDGLSGIRVERLFQDREGALWAWTDQGLNRVFHGTIESLGPAKYLSGGALLAIFEDREGNLWLGTESDGVTVLREQEFTTYTTEDGLAGNVIQSVEQGPDGAIWVGTDGGGLSRRMANGFIPPDLRQRLSSNVILSIAAAVNGDVWVGTPGGLNLIREGRVTLFTTADGLADDYVRSLYMDADGSLWIGTRHGLSHRTADRFETYTATDGLGGDYIGAILRGHNGDLWICTSGGLTRMKGGQFLNFSAKEGLSNSVVTAIYEDAEGALWLGTNGGGLNRLNQLSEGGSVSIRPIHDAKGALPAIIYGLLEDTSGNLWISAKTGIYRASMKSLNESLDDSRHQISVRAYGTADGMRVRECSGGGHPAAWRMQDGSLWFATMRGVAVTNPQSAPAQTVSPLVTIEAVLVDDRVGDRSTDISISPGSHRVEFRYAGLSFASPQQVHYRYMLEGFDRSWVEAGNQRRAVYTNLPPRSYSFRVMASNGDGVWSETEAASTVTIRPYFYQTIWFWLLVALAGAGLIWAFYRLRVQRVRSEFDAVLAERTRIAREIHDGLAQGIVSISLQLELVSRLLGTSTQAAKEQLDLTRGLVKHSLTDARTSIWDLRSQGIDITDLPARLSQALQRISTPAGMQVRLQVSGTHRPIESRIENELLRIGVEAVTNAVRHAEAANIEVGLVYSGSTVRLRVQDDGKGFEPAMAEHDKPGHFGIRGMKERAAAIGGALSIDSKPDIGTSVGVEVTL